MSKVKVLIFAADPLSAHGFNPRLLLDEDVRQIREKVRAAEHRDALEFDVRLAVRTNDLLQALNETRPQVVHFSGHGEADGLVLMSSDGQNPHQVEVAALAQLLGVFRGDIRLVVLNACFSLPQAEAIAAVVGCAIGTRGPISDEGAITFGASFYRAIEFGHSVQAAFDQARAALALEHPDDHECPQLVVRPGVDAARLVLVPPRGSRPLARRAGAAVVAVALASGAVLAVDYLRGQFRGEPMGGPPDPVMASTTPGGAPNAGGDLAAARSLYEARNYAAAFPLFLRAAEADNPEAMGFVGTMHLRGEGTPRSPELGILWLRRAAAARDVRGMNALADAYRDGDGVTPSFRWAKYWYEVAATERSNAEAMRSLGSLYQGAGADSSHARALDWYRKAVRAGSVDAMVDIGLMHEKGLGTASDTAEALRWYTMAAQGESPEGMFAVGRIYQYGIGVPADFEQARVWYQKAAAAGSADAMNNLGLLYHNGLGVPADSAEALRWFQRAADAGSSVARSNLAALEVG